MHSSLSRTWKTPKPSMGIFRPLCKAADGFRGDGVGLITTSSRPPTTTTTPSPPPVRTGRGSTDLLFQNAKISPGQCPGDIFVISLCGDRLQRSLYIFPSTAFPHGSPTSCVNGRLISKQEGKSKSDPPYRWVGGFLCSTIGRKRQEGLRRCKPSWLSCSRCHHTKEDQAGKRHFVLAPL